jgi:hypothetical protein
MTDALDTLNKLTNSTNLACVYNSVGNQVSED